MDVRTCQLCDSPIEDGAGACSECEALRLIRQEADVTPAPEPDLASLYANL